MRYLFFISMLLIVHFSYAQNPSIINSTNYYDYLSPQKLKGTELTTDWLRLDDAVPILLEELKKAGYDWLYDRTIYKLKNGQRINISAYSRKSNIGFLYIEGHYAFPEKSSRNFLFKKENSTIEFIECEETYSGKAEFNKITEIPSNIFVLKEDCYFFQYTNNPTDDKILITKAIAVEILRHDIRKYLSTAPKPKM
jgi:hypothetical protein